MSRYADLPVTEGFIEGFSASRVMFEALLGELAGPATAALTHDGLETVLEERGRDLLRQLFQDHLDLRALREERLPAVTGSDGVQRRRAEHGHTRTLATIFGKVTVTRIAYRAPSAANLYPADAVLNLPHASHSHELRRRSVIEAVRGSFTAATQAITRRCGNVAGKRQIEDLVVAAAADLDAFYATAAPMPCTDDTPLILSVDGKGIVMRAEALREATRKAAETHTGVYATRLVGGEKPNRKRMATLGVVYDADPVPRAPGQIITLPEPDTRDDNRDGNRSEGRAGDGGPVRPAASAKWLIGSVIDSAEDVIATVFDHAEQRDPGHRRPWVVLVDGARHQLDLIQAQAQQRGITVHIIVDLIHVFEYIWKAARSFFYDTDPAAEPWVAAHVLDLLHGRADEVISALDEQATTTGLSAGQRKGVDSCVGYLTAKKPFLGYDVALAKGWPIATGVIEGACRHLIGDRLDITGARWGLAGAEAILKFRAMISNGDFEEYFAFHLRQEHQRVHQARYQHELALGA
jgi:hypothetical protein